MIAPIRLPEDDPQHVAWRKARQAVAALLPRGEQSGDAAPPVPAWQAWMLVGWMAVTALAFVAIMSGNWKEKS